MKILKNIFIILLFFCCYKENSSKKHKIFDTGNDDIDFYNHENPITNNEVYTDKIYNNKIISFINFIHNSSYFNRNYKKSKLKDFYKNVFIFDDPHGTVFRFLIQKKNVGCKKIPYRCHSSRIKNHEKLKIEFCDRSNFIYSSKHAKKEYCYYEIPLAINKKDTSEKRVAVIVRFRIILKNKNYNYCKEYTLLKINECHSSANRIKCFLENLTFKKRKNEKREIFHHKKKYKLQKHKACFTHYIKCYHDTYKSKRLTLNDSCDFYDKYIKLDDTIFVPYPMSKTIINDYHAF